MPDLGLYRGNWLPPVYRWLALSEKYETTFGVKMRVSPPQPNGVPPSKVDALRQQAQALEAAFLSEMLSYSGLDKQSDAFGGGIGEEQFGSFLREEQAKLMVKRGGIGLSESLFRALTTRNND